MKLEEATKAQIGQEDIRDHQNQFLKIGSIIASIVFVTALILVCNGGIRIGFSNHTGLMPVVRRILDANYLPNDFNISLRLYHHRSFAWLAAGFTKLFGEDNTLLSLSIIGNMFLSASLFYLCRTLKLSLLAFLAIGVLIAMNTAWIGKGLEVNTFIGSREIQPTTFSHAFVVLGIAALISKQFKFTAFCAGMSLLFHLQIGFAFALLLLPFYIFNLKLIGMKDALLSILLFLLPVGFTLFDISHMVNRGLMNLPFTRADIDFRQPHHFELASWKSALLILVYLLLQAFTWIYLRWIKNKRERAAFVLFGFSLMNVMLSLIHFADYYYLQSNRIAKFQLVRMSCLITVLGAIAFILLMNELSKSERMKLALNFTLIVFATIFYLIPSTRQGSEYAFRISKYAEQNTSWVNICSWVKENTPVEAVFLTPPGEEGFTYLASRSNIGDFKTNPDGPQYLAAWYERLKDLSGGNLTKGKGFENLALLNRAFASLSKNQLIETGKKYNATYAVLPTKSIAEMQTLYENDKYKVVLLNANESALFISPGD